MYLEDKVMSRAFVEQLHREGEQRLAQKEGLWWFGRRILGGGFRVRGRTFFWGTHRSKPANNKKVWVRP